MYFVKAIAYDRDVIPNPVINITANAGSSLDQCFFMPFL